MCYKPKFWSSKNIIQKTGLPKTIPAQLKVEKSNKNKWRTVTVLQWLLLLS